MIMRLMELIIHCRQSEEHIIFHQFNYFHGQMGAGKSTIARLIDYCLGGGLDEFTPALQHEFVAATLSLQVGDVRLSLYRETKSKQVRARWDRDHEYYDIVIPARSSDVEQIPNTGVKVVSDLVFYLAGYQPPRVRRSKLHKESENIRLSLRNLFWYCYLDQDSMDSSFFHLDSDADYYKRLSSQDVIRLLIGFHQDHVIDLEEKLDHLKMTRTEMESGANALRLALASTHVGSEEQIQEKIEQLREEANILSNNIESIRAQGRHMQNHSVDRLRNEARTLSSELESLEQAIVDVGEMIAEDERHLNELITLKVKFRRTLSARAVLEGVKFVACPECAQSLPDRVSNSCKLCGQSIIDNTDIDHSNEVIDEDIKARKIEISESIRRHKDQHSNLQYRLREFAEKKAELDVHLNDALHYYDSAYLSSALDLERRKASVEQKIRQTLEYRQLLSNADEMVRSAADLKGEENIIFQQLKEARKAAEKDTDNLKRLQELFIDSLVRARVPGFSRTDSVVLRSPGFYPAVTNPDTGDAVITEFGMLGSGGKKTLFKCCFAIAVHRLSAEIGGVLPDLLIIDSPMKNISERENRKQFEGFHRMLYELAVGELSGTQFILIDKEFCGPPSDISIDLYERHMTPDDRLNPPLISYYQGH